MKQFDQASIQTRLETFLKAQPGFAQVLKDSAVESVLYSVSESEAELARYFEYLFQESKWETAQNVSSLISAGKFLGYSPKRQISAMGNIYISHDSLLSQAGTSLIFDSSDLANAGLSSYPNTSFLIPALTAVVSSTGIQFVTMSDTTYYGPNDLSGNAASKYVEVPVIQGIIRTFRTTSGATSTAFESIKIPNPGIEAAYTSLSSPFFQVTIYPSGNSNLNYALTEAAGDVVRYSDIRLASETEYAYDITTLDDYSGVIIRFGDGNSGRLLPPGALVAVRYLETLGTSGNLNQRYSTTRFVVPLSSTQTFYVTNLDPILGGLGNEGIEEIRVNAPNEYLIGGSVITTADYKATLKQIPNILKSNAYAGDYTGSDSITRRVIYLTALDSTQNIPDAATLNQNILNIILDNKSPLDLLQVIDPSIIELKLQAKITSSADQASFSNLATTLETSTLNSFGVPAFDFTKSFYSSDFITLLKNNKTVQQVSPLLESVINIKPSTFLSSGTHPGYYFTNFTFNPILSPLLDLSGTRSDGYCLKINIIFNCVACEGSSRTLMVRQDPLHPGVPIDMQAYSAGTHGGLVLKQYAHISSITDQSFITNSIDTSIVPEILSSAGATYIPFLLDFTYSNLSNSSNLGHGTLYIPLYKSDGTLYAGFTSLDSVTLDETITVEIIAQPSSANITPQNENEFIKVGTNDVSVEVYTTL